MGQNISYEIRKQKYRLEREVDKLQIEAKLLHARIKQLTSDIDACKTMTSKDVSMPEIRFWIMERARHQKRHDTVCSQITYLSGLYDALIKTGNNQLALESVRKVSMAMDQINRSYTLHGMQNLARHASRTQMMNEQRSDLLDGIMGDFGDDANEGKNSGGDVVTVDDELKELQAKITENDEGHRELESRMMRLDLPVPPDSHPRVRQREQTHDVRVLSNAVATRTTTRDNDGKRSTKRVPAPSGTTQHQASKHVDDKRQSQRVAHNSRNVPSHGSGDGVGPSGVKRTFTTPAHWTRSRSDDDELDQLESDYE